MDARQRGYIDRNFTRAVRNRIQRMTSVRGVVGDLMATSKIAQRAGEEVVEAYVRGYLDGQSSRT